MSKSTPEEPKAPNGFTVRPPKSIRPKVIELAAQLDKSEGELASAALRALIQMVESDEIVVPPLVTLARTVRAARATMLDEPRLVAGSESRDKREVSIGYPAHPGTDFYTEILAGKPCAVAAGVSPEKIRIPAGVARVADFAVSVRGDSMEPLISEGEVAVFRRAEVAGNGQIVAAVVGGQMMLKKFMQKNGGPARLESLNAKYQPIPIDEDVRIQGIYEGKFDPYHAAAA